MKRTLPLIATLLLMTATASAQDYGQTATLKIWDNTTAPHSNGITTPETEKEPNRVRNTSEATLYIFPADKAKATGQAVVICPGGGYGMLAMDHEGYEMAKWFAANGITGAVLKYRMPNHHPEVPLEDAVQALAHMAGLEAGATGYTADKVGIVGSSAGGHLAAMASTIGSFKPAFSVLFYPVITAVQGKRHQGSFINLLSEQRTPEQDAAYSLESRVTADTPPAILLLSDDDKTVPPVNSTLYYNALKAHGIEASMHIYPSGGHGWGIRDSFRYKAQWRTPCWTGSAGSTNKQAGHEPRPGSRTPARTGTAARRLHPGGNPARGVPSVGFSGPCIADCRLFPIVPCERTPVPRESRCGLRLIF